MEILKYLKALPPETVVIVLPFLVVIWWLIQSHHKSDERADKREMRRDNIQVEANVQIAKLIEKIEVLTKLIEMVLRTERKPDNV